MPDNRIITHYGTKGMRWGVRKSRTFLTGNPKTSLLHPKGRKAFKKDVAKGKAAVKKMSDSKLFKATIINKETSLLTAAGRTKLKKERGG